MESLNLIQSIAKIAVFIYLLLAFFLFTVSGKLRLSNVLFAVFLILIALDTSGFFWYQEFLKYPNFEAIRVSSSLLQMPFFYLYILSLCYSDFRLRRKHLFMIMPFLIVSIWLNLDFYGLGENEKQIFLESVRTTPALIFLDGIVKVQSVFYIICSFITINSYKIIYQENYTNHSQFTYRWLIQLIALLSIATILTIFKSIIGRTNLDEAFLWANIIVSISALIIICWFILKVLYNPDFFRGIEKNLQRVSDYTETILPDKSVQLDTMLTGEVELRIQNLKNYMRDKAPYLEPDLTLQQLAGKLNIPARELSVLINRHMKQHFFDFVNEYRIQKAMAVLKDTKKKELTIAEIYYQVGFNSKSSFNTCFKKYTKKTPTQFREN
jgi:AraC-like DNA-binding protein